MSRPPSYATMSRTKDPEDDYVSVADMMLRTSLSGTRSASASSSASTTKAVPTHTSTLPTPPASPPTAGSSSTGSAAATRHDSLSSTRRSSKSGAADSRLSTGTTSATRERLRLAEAELSELRKARESDRTRTASRHASTASTVGKTAATTSRTRECLRKAEEERDELRRAVEGEKAIAERLKREGGAGFVSATEAEIRLRDLKRDVKAAEAATRPRSTSGMFGSICSVDMLFLMDTTGSMGGHIDAAKSQVRSIVNDLHATFLNESQIRIAVVGYKDHCDNPNIQFLDFTTSTEIVHSFLNELHATGGQDAPEDVLGGIQQALNASWTQDTRCIIHIADAPPHGSNLHDINGSGDSYYTPGSEPHRLTHDPLIKQMISLKINYALLRINETTDRMVYTFSQMYAAASADCKLHKLNKYYGHSSGSFTAVGSRPGRNAKAGLQFVEDELGTTFSQLQHLVVKIVTSSAARTAVRTLAATRGVRGSHLSSIKEDGDRHTRLETGPPQWHVSGWLNTTLMVEGFSPDVVTHSVSTLRDMMARDDNIKMSVTELTIQVRSLPFAEGALRTAAYARTAASTNHFVVKTYKRGGKRMAHVAEDMRCQALCKAFALEFNALSGDSNSIDFIVTTCLKGKSTEECMSLEPLLEGEYVKYNSNCGYVRDNDEGDSRFNDAAQAFSHFTFERSRGEMLVCDLQGSGHLLTDPAIHTRNRDRFKLSDTNLGEEGFKFFFATHVCNTICRNLGLVSNRDMLLSKAYRFREAWPFLKKTVCCSNKLCGKILRISEVRNSDRFPGFYWCDNCFPQLNSSIVKWICTEPGEHHEFEVSRFFYESQGKCTPRMCAGHRTEDVTGLRRRVGSTSSGRVRSPTAEKSLASGLFSVFRHK